MPATGLEVELDRCIDQLLRTGGWEVPPAEARAEIDSLMRVASLLRALILHIAHPRPNQKDRVWMSVSNSLRVWNAAVERHCGRLDRSRTKPDFGPI